MKKNTKLIIGILSIVIIVCVAAVLVFTGKAKGKSDYDKHIIASQQYVDELDYERAIVELELAIEIEPNNAKAYLALAEVYVEMEDYESAALVLEEAKEKVGNANEVAVALEKVKEKADGQAVIDEQNLNEVVNQRKEVYEDGSYSILEYDESGYPVKSTYYKEDGTIDYCLIFENDANGRFVKVTGYYSNGSVIEDEYGESEYPMKSTHHEEDGSYSVWEYDINGNPVKGSCYNPNGTWYVNEYEYDINGNRVKMTYYDSTGLSSVEEYDENGNLINEYALE